MFEGMSPFGAFLFMLMVLGFATATSLIAWIVAGVAALIAERSGSLVIPLIAGLAIVVWAVSSIEGLNWRPDFMFYVAIPIGLVFSAQFMAVKLVISRFISRSQIES